MIIGNPNEDFKDQNPRICTFKDFATIYKKEPKNASKILWSYYFITYLHDQYNPYRNLPTLEMRIEAIKEEYFTDFKYEKYKYIVDAFKMVELSKEELMFNVQYKKLEEITTFFDNLDLSLGEGLDEYIKLFKMLPNVWKQSKIIKQEVIETSKNKTTVHGDGELSVSDRRQV